MIHVYLDFGVVTIRQLIESCLCECDSFWLRESERKNRFSVQFLFSWFSVRIRYYCKWWISRHLAAHFRVFINLPQNSGMIHKTDHFHQLLQAWILRMCMATAITQLQIISIKILPQVIGSLNHIPSTIWSMNRII